MSSAADDRGVKGAGPVSSIISLSLRSGGAERELGDGASSGSNLGGSILPAMAAFATKPGGVGFTCSTIGNFSDSEESELKAFSEILFILASKDFPEERCLTMSEAPLGFGVMLKTRLVSDWTLPDRKLPDISLETASPLCASRSVRGIRSPVHT